MIGIKLTLFQGVERISFSQFCFCWQIHHAVQFSSTDSKIAPIPQQTLFWPAKKKSNVTEVGGVTGRNLTKTKSNPMLDDLVA